VRTVASTVVPATSRDEVEEPPRQPPKWKRWLLCCSGSHPHSGAAPGGNRRAIGSRRRPVKPPHGKK
jgi:hypothetical protein